jgi:hypothetical protein
MKSRLLVIAMFLGLVVVGSVAYAAIDAFVLRHVDGKFAHSAIDQFTLILVLCAILAIGSVVPVAALILGLGRLVVPHRLVFAVVSATVVLASFATGAYAPLAVWIQPAMPNAIYPFVVAAIIGGVGAIAGLAACLVHKQAGRA